MERLISERKIDPEDYLITDDGDVDISNRGLLKINPLIFNQ